MNTVVKKRAFELLRMHTKASTPTSTSSFDDQLADGIQVLRYNVTNGYREHHDYFPIGSEGDEVCFVCPLLARLLSFSCTHSLSLTLFMLYLALSLSLSHILSSLALSLARSLSFSLFHSRSLSFSLSLSHSTTTTQREVVRTVSRPCSYTFRTSSSAGRPRSHQRSCQRRRWSPALLSLLPKNSLLRSIIGKRRRCESAFRLSRRHQVRLIRKCLFYDMH